jgi:hypothetical protein
VEQVIEEEGFVYPSAVRRFIVFIGWLFSICIPFFIFIDVVTEHFFPGYTSGQRLPEPIEFLEDLVFAITFISLALAGARGLLPGAKRQRVSEQ